MRADMSKVVTERPRSDSSAPSLKTALTIHRDHIEDDDHGLTRFPHSKRRQHGYDAKEFSDLLGPLRRYLRKQVGRPWDKIFSELCETLDRRSLSGIHIWDHVKSEVEPNAQLLPNGKVLFSSKYGRHGLQHEIYGFYVHPRTRLLCYKQFRRERYRKKDDPNVKVLGAMQELHKLNGCWFLVNFHMVPKFKYASRKTLNILNQVVYESVAVPDGEKKAILSKKQLNKQELRDHKLKNDSETLTSSKLSVNK